MQRTHTQCSSWRPTQTSHRPANMAAFRCRRGGAAARGGRLTRTLFTPTSTSNWKPAAAATRAAKTSNARMAFPKLQLGATRPSFCAGKPRGGLPAVPSLCVRDVAAAAPLSTRRRPLGSLMSEGCTRAPLPPTRSEHKSRFAPCYPRQWYSPRSGHAQLHSGQCEHTLVAGAAPAVTAGVIVNTRPAAVPVPRHPSPLGSWHCGATERASSDGCHELAASTSLLLSC
jgi:hypothetical protein